MQGLNLLQDAIGKERRPLSWVIGPQGVERSDRPSQRDMNRTGECAREGCAVPTRSDLERDFIQRRPGTERSRHSCGIEEPLWRGNRGHAGNPRWHADTMDRAEQLCDILRYLKLEAQRPYRMLYDLTAIDERTRVHRDNQPRAISRSSITCCLTSAMPTSA